MKLTRLVTCALLAATLLFAPGCTSDGAHGGGSGPIAFTPEPAVEGTSVVLRGRPAVLEPTHVLVDVVARGAASVHGAAFRVTWDPEAMTFVSASSGAAWSRTALAMAREGSPGQLAVAWTEKGETGIDATADTVLGTLVFEVKGQKGTTISFNEQRSQLVDRKGARIATRWRNDTLAAR